MTDKDAIELCQEIVEMIDDLPESTVNRASDFFEDVRQKVCDVEETITRRQEVTDRQAKALANWKAGVKAWIR